MQDCFKILGMEEVRDEAQIKAHYHERLLLTNPEDDPEGFKQLREAYEAAIAWARSPQETQSDAGREDEAANGSPWIQWALDIYNDPDSRRDIEKWKELFDDPYCLALDTAAEAREEFLIFLMKRYYLPGEVWKLIDQVFCVIQDELDLREKFPVEYLRYLKYEILNESTFPYAYTEVGILDNPDELDMFYGKLIRMKTFLDQDTEESVVQAETLYGELGEYDIHHPYVEVEHARLLLKQGSGDEAIRILFDAAEKYPTDTYILFRLADSYEMQKDEEHAKERAEQILQLDPDHYSARILMARLLIPEDPLKAKDIISDLLDENGRDGDVLDMMRKVNVPLIDYYQKLITEDPANELANTIEKCWCLFQNERYQEVLDLLLHREILPDSPHYYDSVNVIGRCYVGLEQYKEAIPFLLKWKEARENLKDDGSKKYKKRREREGYILATLGVCRLNTKNYEEAEKYLVESIQKEPEEIGRVTYMERLSLLYYLTGRFEECVDICTKVLDQEVDYYPVYIRRMEALYELHDGQGVINDYYAAVNLFPEYHRPYVLAARIFSVFQQYEDVMTVVNKARENGVDHVWMDYYEVRARRALCNTEAEKEELLQRIRALYTRLNSEKYSREKDQEKPYGDMTDCQRLDAERKKDYPEEDVLSGEEVALEEVLLYMDYDDYDSAESILEQLEEANPDSVRLQWIHADLLRLKGEYREAVQKYTEIEPRVFENAEIIYDKALCLERMNCLGEARKELERVRKKNPRHPRVNHALMRIHSHYYNRYEYEEEYKKAVEAINHQLENVQDAYYYIERGLLHMSAYHTEEAEQDYKKALEMEPDNTYALNNLGVVYRTIGDDKQAEKMFRAAIEKRGEETTMLPYLNLVKCYMAMKRYDEGAALLMKLHESGEQSKTTYEKLLEIRRSQGNYAEAEAIVRQMLAKKYYTESCAQDKLCILAYMRGDWEYAKKLWNKNLGKRKYLKRGIDKKKTYSPQEMAQFRQDLESYERYIQCLLYTRELKKAIKESEKLIQLYNDSGIALSYSVLLHLALAVRLSGDRNRAATVAANALQILIAQQRLPKGMAGAEENDAQVEERYASFPRYSPVRCRELAIIYMCMGNMDRARVYLKRAESAYHCEHCSFAACFDATQAWGYLYELGGDIEEAYKQYRRAYEINPGDYEEELVMQYYKKKYPTLQ